MHSEQQDRQRDHWNINMMLMMYDKEGGELKYGNKTAFCCPPWTESDEEKKKKEERERN